MPELTFNSQSKLVVNVHLTSTSLEPDVAVLDLGAGTISLEVGNSEVGVRLIGSADVLSYLLSDALDVIRGTSGGSWRKNEPTGAISLASLEPGSYIHSRNGIQRKEDTFLGFPLSSKRRR